MASTPLAFLGLQAGPGGQQPLNYGPWFLFANWWFAYCTLSTRFSKIALGIDHNSSPRLDLVKYGDEAVRAGKLSQEKLDQLHRREAAHQNSVEGFTLFVAGGQCIFHCLAYGPMIRSLPSF